MNNRNADIDLNFGDGEYNFRLPFASLRRLQEKCDAGPYVILNRLLNGQWLVDDIAETIRYGLLGGDNNLTAVQATKLVKEYVEERPPLENVAIAIAALTAAVAGAPEEDKDQKKEVAADVETILPI